MNNKLQLFSTGMLQVFFVAVNTVFLSKSIYIGVAFAAFTISMIWSYNVKKVVFGTMKDRICYSFGAMIGSLLGLLLSDFLINIIQKLWQ
jgi:hypothetical protein